MLEVVLLLMGPQRSCKTSYRKYLYRSRPQIHTWVRIIAGLFIPNCKINALVQINAGVPKNRL